MAGDLPPLRVEITVNTSDLRKAETDSARMAKNVGNSAEQASKNVQRGMNGITKAAQFAAAAIGTAFAIDAIKTFAEVQDAVSALEATYGDSAEAFKKFADEQAIAYNLSKREALGAQQTFANFAKAAGLSGRQLEDFAIDLTERAADMASYFGGTTSQAIEAVGAALRGESEPIRRYGVLLDDMTMRAEAMKLGLISSTKDALTPQQKVLAANSLILQKTSQTQGDVARTADSMANQIKNASAQYDDLKTSIGETLAVAAKPLLEFLNNTLGKFNELPQSTKTIVIGLGAIGTAAVILVPKIMAIRTAFLRMQTAAAASGRGSVLAMGGASKKAIGFAAAITAVSVAAASTDSTWIDFGSNLDDITDKGQKTANAIYGIIDPGAYKSAMNFAEGFVGAFLPIRPMLTAEKEAVAAFDAQLAALVMDGKAEEAARQFDRQADAAAKYGATADEVRSLLPQYATAIEETGKSAENASGGMGQFSDATQTAEERAKALDDATKNLKGSLDALLGTQMGSEQATMRVEEAYDSARKAYKENSLTLDMTTGKGRANRDSLINLATASIESAEAFAQNGESLDTIRDKMQTARDQFIAVATKMTGSSEKARELADSYGLVPDRITTAVEQSGILAAIENQQDYNRELERTLELQDRLAGIDPETRRRMTADQADRLLGAISTDGTASTRTGGRGRQAAGESAGSTTVYVNAQGLTVDEVSREATRRARLLAPTGATP